MAISKTDTANSFFVMRTTAPHSATLCVTHTEYLELYSSGGRSCRRTWTPRGNHHGQQLHVQQRLVSFQTKGCQHRPLCSLQYLADRAYGHGQFTDVATSYDTECMAVSSGDDCQFAATMFDDFVYEEGCTGHDDKVTAVAAKAATWTKAL